MLEKPTLYVKLAGYVIFVLYSELRRALKTTWIQRQASWFGPVAPSSRTRNIVIVGASFAGNHVAHLLTTSLPPNSPYRVIVIEPNSHFQFTWVLPKLCVIKGHEHKAFIPYGGTVFNKPEGVLRWIQDRVTGVTKHGVTLEKSNEEVPYDILVIATGSGVEKGLPSRVNATDKLQGMQLMREMQIDIESAKTVVIVGGGAAGVEVATDAKALYPYKNIILVHSRKVVMHRFGSGLQKSALEGLERLGVEVILGERVVENRSKATVTLTSGRELECDLIVNCTGQKPSSEILANLSPSIISPNGHIKVKSTLQVADVQLPNVYACGDVANTNTPNPNARSAMRQAAVVADNILLVARGKDPRNEYANYWPDGVIKLTLGLDRSVTHLGDGVSELLFKSKETDEALMSAMCWARMGQKPFDDPYMKERNVGSGMVTR
ncbi:Apoptosis-inducing factor 2 [Tolypocladium ophioglossoides CBS 100239]|uniref:Apoptosis-inducing factor 2 n=1 Tax=Tolypocladium ophioglossoides (strain CBS 100239) TaxID=1163406 RepID=A0A0L0MYG6_TOLOC|nr:Apoptosis-inducing factor 2 [Tolypocladium ophioglossoides CBS 100239]